MKETQAVNICSEFSISSGRASRNMTAALGRYLTIKKTLNSKPHRYFGELYKFNIPDKSSECLNYDINNIYASDDGIYCFENEVLLDIANGERHIINAPEIVNVSNGFAILDAETVYDLNSREMIGIDILNTALIDGNIIKLV